MLFLTFSDLVSWNVDVIGGAQAATLAHENEGHASGMAELSKKLLSLNCLNLVLKFNVREHSLCFEALLLQVFCHMKMNLTLTNTESL